MTTFAYPRNFTGGRCDFYLKIKRCLKRDNSENFVYFSLKKASKKKVQNVGHRPYRGEGVERSDEMSKPS